MHKKPQHFVRLISKETQNNLFENSCQIQKFSNKKKKKQDTAFTL